MPVTFADLKKTDEESGTYIWGKAYGMLASLREQPQQEASGQRFRRYAPSE